MRNLLGGKGANLAEMNLIGLPVPAGFTITTEICTLYNKEGREAVVRLIEEDVKAGIAQTEKIMNAKFGSKGEAFPLLVSVRSGARVSMPGMMDTVLNLGMNDDAVKIVAEKSGNARFAWDSYRRFVQMYGGVVMGIAAAKGEHDPFEAEIDRLKAERNISSDTDFTVEDLQSLVTKFKGVVKARTGKEFPTNPWEQLWGAICAVFDSWNTERAILYRQLNQIPEEWGTAVNVQAMVYGNMGNRSATGVAFTRDAATGENIFNGEYLINAQGEDVVAGIRTPQEITLEGSRRWARQQNIAEEVRASFYPSLEEAMPQAFADLNAIQHKLENYFHDMQDLEFTIQDGKLWMLQTRNGKRTGSAMVKMAVDMLKEGLIDEKTALLRLEPNKLDELLHPVFDREAKAKAKVLTKGLPASPGAACGRVVFFADEAETWQARGEKVILGGQSDGTRRNDVARSGGGPGNGQVLRVGSRGVERGLPEAVFHGAKHGGVRGRLDFAERLDGRGLPRQGGDGGGRVVGGFPDNHGAGRQVHADACADERGHAARRTGGPGFRGAGHRLVPHGAHVLRRRPHQGRP